MTSRREFVVGAAAVAAAGAAPGFATATSKSAVRIKGAVRRDETVIRYGGHGDNWHLTWGRDGRQYASLCDGAGFAEKYVSTFNTRLIAIEGGPTDARFHDVPDYPLLGPLRQKWGDARYYGFGTLAVNGQIYQFLSTFNRALEINELENTGERKPLRFNGAKLIYSPDQGRTWRNQDGSTPVVWEDWKHRSRETMVFFEEDQEAFSLLSVLQMGRDYRANSDGYVYVYAPNGNTEGTMNELVMFRVPKRRILERARYEYFAGLDARGGARWTPDIQLRKPVHVFPRGWVNKGLHPFAWHPSVVYNAPLGVYLMVNWGMGTDAAGEWFTKPNYLGFWIAPQPWGPWRQIHEETVWMPAGDRKALAYEPQIAPKWIAADGRSFWLVWTDSQTTDAEGLRKAGEEINRKGRNKWDLTDFQRRKQNMRKYNPYYAFNVQRVDLVLR